MTSAAHIHHQLAFAAAMARVAPGENAAMRRRRDGAPPINSAPHQARRTHDEELLRASITDLLRAGPMSNRDLADALEIRLDYVTYKMKYLERDGICREIGRRASQFGSVIWALA